MASTNLTRMTQPMSFLQHFAELPDPTAKLWVTAMTASPKKPRGTGVQRRITPCGERLRASERQETYWSSLD